MSDESVRAVVQGKTRKIVTEYVRKDSDVVQPQTKRCPTCGQPNGQISWEELSTIPSQPDGR